MRTGSLQVAFEATVSCGFTHLCSYLNDKNGRVRTEALEVAWKHVKHLLYQLSALALHDNTSNGLGFGREGRVRIKV